MLDSLLLEFLVPTVDVEDALQMVVLMLDDTGQESLRIQGEGLSLLVQGLDGNLCGPGYLFVYVGVMTSQRQY